MNKHGILDRVQAFDDRRDIVVPGDQKATLAFCQEHFVTHANISIRDHGYFAVALSGGSTPAAIYRSLAENQTINRIDWSKVFLFWSDERSVPPTDKDSNYRMAMDAGLSKLPIPPKNIFRMHAEESITTSAESYEETIKAHLPSGVFDMVMLGMGNDGHTASLFPHTHGLHVRNRLAIANWIPQLNTWRMSLTFECINAASAICIYVLGEGKAKTLTQVLTSSPDPDGLPSQRLGTPNHKALWIVDVDAAEDLLTNMAGSEPSD